MFAAVRQVRMFMRIVRLIVSADQGTVVESFRLALMPFLLSSAFDSNYAGELGGAIHCYESMMSFNNCTFDNNVATGDGGALRVSYSSTVTINRSRFTGNQGEAMLIAFMRFTATFSFLFFPRINATDQKQLLPRRTSTSKCVSGLGPSRVRICWS